MALPKPPELPDPAIYSQEKLHLAGTLPSWDTPDISAIEWRPRHTPGVKSVAWVRVHNHSSTTSAVNVAVVAEMSEFGIGTPREPVASLFCSVGPNAHAVIEFPVPQKYGKQASAGVHVTLMHPTDSDRSNNAGSQALAFINLNVASVTTRLRVRNPAAQAAVIQLRCVANGTLSATATPSSVALQPGAEASVDIEISRLPTAPAVQANVTEGAVTVIGVGPGNSLVGGVTYLVL
ncbi:hypothetical protein [Methylibium sp.]|uniref:hypothetical protein n=1 Tax=Methylibium sp. TaxID=2067992 RepID=UPI00183A4B2F|nr:hypothetical protein [Methylibium sp.]MBA3590814.1 hypothetical protein [Methylibium sp.]